MNRKAYSLFLSVLLASTFIHDFNVKALTPPSLHNCQMELVCRDNTGSSIFSTPTTLTTEAPTTITTEAPTTTTTDTPTKTPTKAPTTTPQDLSKGLHVFVNIEGNLLIISNNTAGAAYVIDEGANITALFNAKSQTVVVINIASNSGVYITKKDNVIKTGNFLEYLKSLKGLQSLLQIQGATKFKVSSASENILNAVNDILASLIEGLQVEVKTNPKVGIKLVTAMESKWAELLQGNLKGVLTVLGSSGITVPQGLAALINILDSIGIIVAELGGISALKKAGVKIDLQKLASGVDSLQILATFLLGIGRKVNTGKALSDLLNNPTAGLKLLAELGGNVDNSITGMLKLYTYLVGLIKKEVPLEITINVIIHFLTTNRGTEKAVLLAQFKKSINVLLNGLSKVKATDSLKGFIDTLIKIRDGKLVTDGVNVSKIVDHILDGLKNPHLLGVVVSALTQLRSVVSLQDGIPILVLILILNVNSPLGINLLRGLGPLLNVSLGGLLSTVGGILGFLLSKVTNLIGLLSGGIFGALQSIPVIGDLLKALQKALSVAGVEASLNSLLSSSEANDLLKALMQIVLNLRLGASQKAVQKVQEVREKCASVNSYLCINVTMHLES